MFVKVYAPLREKWVTYATPVGGNGGRWPLGSTLMTPNGDIYRFARNGGAAAVVANVQMGVVALANHTNITCDVARAVGAEVISITLGNTAAAVDIYAEGKILTRDSAGEGYAYRIKHSYQTGDAHASAAGTAVITVNLAEGETVQTALTTASEVSLVRNRFHSHLIAAAPATAQLAGVALSAVATNTWSWLQTGGEAAVLADGTLVDAEPAQASTAVAGAAMPFNEDATVNIVQIGTVVRASATTEHALIDLRIP